LRVDTSPGALTRSGQPALFETQEHSPNLMCPLSPLAGDSQNAAPVQFVSDAAQGRYAIGLNALDDSGKVGPKPPRPRCIDLASAVAMAPRWRFANTATGRERFCAVGMRYNARDLIRDATCFQPAGFHLQRTKETESGIPFDRGPERCRLLVGLPVEVRMNRQNVQPWRKRCPCRNRVTLAQPVAGDQNGQARQDRMI
jgi:hypothetical protein